jgi:polysaccharide export outer membrane protein
VSVHARRYGGSLTRLDRARAANSYSAWRLADLLKKGESKANVLLMPGDVIIIPESTF